MFVDGRGNRGLEDGRVSAAGGRGRDTRCALAAVAAMAQLVVMEATGQLCFLEVCCDVLVGHLLETCLEQVNLLWTTQIGHC